MWLAGFSLTGTLQPIWVVVPYGPALFQTGSTYYFCPGFFPNGSSSAAGSWTLSVYLNGSTTPSFTVSFPVTTGTGGAPVGGTGGGPPSYPTNSTSFGPSCVGSFVGQWNSNTFGLGNIN